MLAGVKTILHSTCALPAVVSERLTSKWVVIVGHSMVPTVHDGQRVRVSRRALNREPPIRGAIAFFEHPDRDGFWEVKRIVGLPGETVDLDAGRLVIDGRRVDEPYVHGVQPRVDSRWRLGPDEYILFGDNRRRSTDSRSYGPVSRQRFLGLVVLPQNEPVAQRIPEQELSDGQ